MSVEFSDPRELAIGWKSAWLAVGTDDSSPALAHKLEIERHPAGLRFTATDGAVLATSWTPFEPRMTAAPELDEAPETVTVVHDPYSRVAGLLTHIAKLHKPEKDDGERHVIRFGWADEFHGDPDEALMFPPDGALVVSTDTGETIELPTYVDTTEMYPTWRRLMPVIDPTYASGHGLCYSHRHLDVAARIAGQYTRVSEHGPTIDIINLTGSDRTQTRYRYASYDLTETTLIAMGAPAR